MSGAVLAVTMALLAVASAVHAAPLLLLDDGRYVYAFVEVCDATCEEVYDSASDFVGSDGFGSWSASTYTPAIQGVQDSVVGPEYFGGTGGMTFQSLSSAYPPGTSQPEGNADATSRFVVTFAVTSPTAIDLSGVLTASTADAGYSLARTTGEVIVADAIFSGAGVPFAWNGILQPGDYELDVYADRTVSGTASWEFAMLVPEPATGWMVAAGLLVAAAPGAGQRRERRPMNPPTPRTSQRG